MPLEEPPTDDYVVELLKRDATAKATRNPNVGYEGLLNRRPTGSAPKPNTKFLKSLLRDTDSHNAALLAKEAEESRARLRKLREERRSKGRPEQALYSARARHESDSEVRRKRRKMSDDEADERRPRLKYDRNDREERDSRHEHIKDRRHGKRHHRINNSDEEDNEARSRHRHHRDRGGRQRSRSPRNDRRREDRPRRRTRSRSPSSSRSHDRDRHRRHRYHKRDSRSSEPDDAPERSRKPTREPQDGTKESPPSGSRGTVAKSPASDSDPLEAIIGPPPPPPKPPVRSRGRGAFSKPSAIDSHFASGYDPSADVSLDPDEADDWDQALEALRDRQKWKQQGAERLRAAGFTDEEVRKWEKGSEKAEEDVRWSKKGEGREWDRGKVVDEDGMVDVKAEWGRLKGT